MKFWKQANARISGVHANKRLFIEALDRKGDHTSDSNKRIADATLVNAQISVEHPANRSGHGWGRIVIENSRLQNVDIIAPGRAVEFRNCRLDGVTVIGLNPIKHVDCTGFATLVNDLDDTLLPVDRKSQAIHMRRRRMVKP